jgi:hypothetical protein
MAHKMVKQDGGVWKIPRACQCGGRSGRDFVMPRARKKDDAAQNGGGDVMKLFLPL